MHRFCIGPLVSLQVLVQVFTSTIQKMKWIPSSMRLKPLLISSRLNTSVVRLVSCPFLSVWSLSHLSCCTEKKYTYIRYKENIQWTSSQTVLYFLIWRFLLNSTRFRMHRVETTIFNQHMRNPRSMLCSKMLCYICVLHLTRQLAINYIKLVSTLSVMR